MENEGAPDHIDLAEDAIERLRRQQATLTQIGEEAVQANDPVELLQLASQRVAAGLNISFTKVLQYRPQPDDFVLIAGVGWPPDVVGKLVMANGLSSPAGLAFHIDGPATSNDLDHETRFQVPSILRQNGVKSASNVVIRTRRGRWGVLEADSRHRHAFDDASTDFLLGCAHLLGLSLSRCEDEARSR